MGRSEMPETSTAEFVSTPGASWALITLQLEKKSRKLLTPHPPSPLEAYF